MADTDTDTGTVEARRSDRTVEAVGTAAFLGGLTLLCGVVFWPSISTGFVIDDWGYLNVTLQDGWWTSGLLRDLSAQVLRPVTVVAIGVQHELFGYDPRPFHLVALGLLLVQGTLLYLVARRLQVGVFGARAAAALLMLHSTNGWTLSWTASTSSYYAIVLSLAVVYVVSVPEMSGRRTAAAALLLVIGLFTREIVIMVPFIVLAVRVILGAGGLSTRIRVALRETAPLIGLLVVFIGARVTAALYANTQPSDDRLIPILNLSSSGEALPMVPEHAWSIAMLATSPFSWDIDAGGLRFPLGVALVGLVFWAVVVTVVAREYRAGRLVPLLGLVWFVLAAIPPIFLQAEITYGNYADLAVPGLALSLGAAIGSAMAGRSTVVRVGVAVAGLTVLTWIAHNGGNELVQPVRPPIARAIELEAWARATYPDPEPGTTLVVPDAIPEDPLWTSNGDLFRVIYQDPTLQVVFEPGPAGSGG